MIIVYLVESNWINITMNVVNAPAIYERDEKGEKTLNLKMYILINFYKDQTHDTTTTTQFL